MGGVYAGRAAGAHGRPPARSGRTRAETFAVPAATRLSPDRGMRVRLGEAALRVPECKAARQRHKRFPGNSPLYR